jgi:thioredoxin reductase (NADPH)
VAEPHLRAVAFPTLDEAQITRLGHCGGANANTYSNGQALFHAGDRDFKFFVVKSGAIEIMDVSGETPRRGSSRARRI